jgi:biotin carboxylase
MLHVLMVGHSDQLLEGLLSGIEGGRVTVLEDPSVSDSAGLRERVAAGDARVSALWRPYFQAAGYLDAVRAAHAADRFHVVIAAHEYGVGAAAEIAESLKLHGTGRAAAAVLTDKLDLRLALIDAGLAQPQFRELFCVEDLREAVTAGSDWVLKPANRHGSVGVVFVDADCDLDAAWADTTGTGELDGTAIEDKRLAADRPLEWRYMLEERLRGPEVSTEALVSGGQVGFLNVTAKRVFAGAHPVMAGHQVPAQIDAEIEDELRDGIERLAGAIGFSHGVLHAEWIVTADGPVLIECAGRLPGGSIIELIEDAWGVSLPALLVMTLAGLTPEVPASPGGAAAVGFLTAEPGAVVGVEGLAAARAAPGVVEVEVTVSPGDRVGPLRSSWDRAGHVRVRGDSPAQVRERLAAACELVAVATESLTPAGAVR